MKYLLKTKGKCTQRKGDNAHCRLSGIIKNETLVLNTQWNYLRAETHQISSIVSTILYFTYKWKSGGRNRNRTYDPLRVMQVL